MDGGVGGRAPADLAGRLGPGRERQALAAKPEPDAACGAELAEAIENGADGAADGSIGVEANFPRGLAPNEAERQATPQLPTRRLVADAAVEPGAQDVQLGLGHRSLEP